MGFLDKLLGRGKEEADEGVEDVKARYEGGQEKAEDMAGSGAERAEEMGQGARTEATERIERDTP
jgi:F0F1-type ATP synthase membrane subunit b/b'